ncbi:nuclear transport factor 2 family protein [Streptomyces sp. NPDC090075]|uniref:nuclear transport factor 2 family protein n=1 Tax=Streptomyces sp. NPDC090075 TaxID=3365937 RepID=UPI00380E4C86
MTSRNVTENPAAHAAIRHLVDAYTDYTNAREWDNLGSLLAEKVVWRVMEGDEAVHSAEGRDAVTDAIKGQVEAMTVLVQMVHATNISVSGDRATARSTMEAMGVHQDGRRQNSFAQYSDEIVREDDGEWRFLSRVFRLKGSFVEPA